MPSPLIVVCWIRGILWSMRFGAPVAGHVFEVQPKEKRESPRLHQLKCVTCGQRETIWE